MEQNQDDFFDFPEPAPSPAPAKAKKNPAKTISCVFGALFLATAFFLAGWFGHYYSLDEEVRTYLWAKSVAEKNYYRTVDEAELYARLYDTLSLDPYSELFSPDGYDQYVAAGAGQNAGIGVTFFKEQKEDETARFFSVVENSPASKAGLKKGMYLCAFGASESSLKEGTYSEFRTFLSGRKGSFVLRCGFSPDGSDAENYTLQRENYQAAFVHYRDSESSFRVRYDASVSSSPRLEEGKEPLLGLDATTAYIRLDEFSGNAAAEFKLCLSEMKKRSRENLILDLRSNGGGYLDILGDIAACMGREAKGKTPVVTVAKYRNGKIAQFVCAENSFSEYFSANSRVYVLADEYTASASECLIGAFIDYKTCSFGDIFLRKNEDGVAKTYGKGIMQSSFVAMNGAAMKLTTATIHWPVSDTCIHGKGVTEEDGAHGIASELIWGEEDVMLGEVLSAVCG